MTHPSISNAIILIVEIRVDNSWISPLTSYLKNGTLPKYKNVAVKIKARVAR